ncbi:hypothetical protein SpCBS45565_g00440 [Spizellomyces sp. 'palustris']|nr:hypothetical protein SpCBS45565_g00440 [Spizellomyces sp. 'palustris']
MARKTISPKPSTPSTSRTDGDLTHEASTPTSTRLCTRRSYAAQGITPVVQKRWGGPTIISYKSLPTTPSMTLEERSLAQNLSTTPSQPPPNLTTTSNSTTKRAQSKRRLKRKSGVHAQEGDKEKTGGLLAKKPRTTKSKTPDSRTEEKQSTLQKNAKEPLEDRYSTTWRTQEERMRKQIEEVVNGGSPDSPTEDTKPDSRKPFEEKENGGETSDAAATGLNDESEPEETRKIPLGEALQLLHRDSLERLLRYAIVEEVVLKPTDIAEELEATGVLQ